jgi:hypothetical protein
MSGAMLSFPMSLRDAVVTLPHLTHTHTHTHTNTHKVVYSFHRMQSTIKSVARMLKLCTAEAINGAASYEARPKVILQYNLLLMQCSTHSYAGYICVLCVYYFT